MSKKRAFVRYTKSGEIVPGSLILTNGSYPDKPALWKEVTTNECCDGGGCSSTPMVGEYRYSTENCTLGDPVQIAVFSCNNELTLKTFPDLLPAPDGYYRISGQSNYYVVENSIVTALAPECP